jgi:EAL domain-containing protein (putative c-di-GMP-specific phosphodiesterase class I)
MVVTTDNDTVLLAEKILKIISEPFFVEGNEVIMTASIGISIFPADGEDAASLLKRSESAMRHAKKTGGKKYQFFAGEMNSRARHRIETENNIRHALEQNEFLLYYQPKIDTKDEAIIGAEALIRWNNPARGLVPPGEFIPIAEESGLILQVGAWVLRHACKQCKDWLNEGLKPIRISINVASHQLRSGDFADQVVAILAETGLPANLLELEITESNMMDNSVACMKVLRTFRDMGIHISIDDFGTGYSCLSYLSRFPITTLKIDRAFVNNLQDSNNAEITRAIISLSHSLKLDVIAEGAEVADQVKFLGIHGCTVVQGFFYSKPVSTEVFEKMLRVGYIHKG